MGKPKFLPTGKNLETAVRRGVEIATFLTGMQSDGEYPFGARYDPGLMFILAPSLFGMTLDDEQASRFAAFHSVTDIRVPSLLYGAAYAYDFVHNGVPRILDWPAEADRDPEWQLVLEEDIFEEGVFFEKWVTVDPPSHYDTTQEYLAELNHPLAGELASHWIHSHNHLRKVYDNSWLNLVDCSAEEAYRRLIADFRGFGPKVSKLFLGRLRRSGLARHLDTAAIGMAVDRHVVRETVSWGLLPDVVTEVRYDPVVRAADALWKMICQKADLPPEEVHQACWTLGSSLCKSVRCDICPLWKHTCIGKLSMSGYNDRQRRTLDPSSIVQPGIPDPEQLQLFEPTPPSGPHESIIRLFMGEMQPHLPNTV